MMLGLDTGHLVDIFKKLQTVTVPKSYVLETLMFVVKNPNKFQTNVSNHSRGMRQILDFIYSQ
jgi:hypothetical protein